MSAPQTQMKKVQHVFCVFIRYSTWSRNNWVFFFFNLCFECISTDHCDIVCYLNIWILWFTSSKRWLSPWANKAVLKHRVLCCLFWSPWFYSLHDRIFCNSSKCDLQTSWEIESFVKFLVANDLQPLTWHLDSIYRINFWIRKRYIRTVYILLYFEVLRKPYFN